MSGQHEWTKQRLTILYPLRHRWPWLLASLLVLAWLSLSFAWVQNTNERGDKSRWAEKTASVAFRLGCENTDTIIEEWGPCWDDVAERAMEAWNDAGSQFRFATTPGPSTAQLSCTRADRTNVVVWGPTLCGQSFSDALAITRTWAWEDGRIMDSDIVFNTRYDWAAYPGPWLFAHPDLHRVAIHEFGHMLGLAHPDDHGQRVTAIMNVYADDIETLQPDDLARADHLRGRSRRGPHRPPIHRGGRLGESWAPESQEELPEWHRRDVGLGV